MPRRKTPPAKRGPRPTFGDAATIKLAADAAEAGLKPKDIAAVCDMTPRNYYKIMAGGRSGESKYLPFYRAVQRAKGRGAREMLRRLQKAADDGKYQAAIWMLERCFGYGAKAVEVVEDEAAEASAADQLLARAAEKFQAVQGDQ